MRRTLISLLCIFTLGSAYAQKEAIKGRIEGKAPINVGLDLVEKTYTCGLDHYLDAIQRDPRFSEIRDVIAIEDLKSIKLWHENDNHLRWSAYAWKHLARYINTAVYQPLADYYPSNHRLPR